jgi:hypothetical protein
MACKLVKVKTLETNSSDRLLRECCLVATFLMGGLASLLFAHPRERFVSSSGQTTQQRVPMHGGGIFEFTNYLPRGRQTPGSTDNPYVRGGHVWVKWSDVEPTKGLCEWRVIDRIAGEWTKMGKRVVLRVGTSPCSRVWAGVPDWVREAGAKMLTHPQTGEVFPVYWDPVYQEKWCRFVRAFAKRYDDDPNVEFVQIGGVGWFGEMMLARQAATGQFASLKDEWREAGYTADRYVKTYRKVLDTYLAEFQHKPVGIWLTKRDRTSARGKTPTNRGRQRMKSWEDSGLTLA